MRTYDDAWPAEFRITVPGTGTHELRLLGGGAGLNRVDCRCGEHLGMVRTTSGTDPVLALWHAHQDEVLQRPTEAAQ